MHNKESILENETQNILWDFEIQTDHLTSTNKKEHPPNSELHRPHRPQGENERKQK